MSTIDHSSLVFNHVTALAVRLGAPILVFDLEGTTFPGRDNFAITEVACFIAMPEGPGVAFDSLFNPERPIDPRASELTGLTNAMLRGKPTWGQSYAQLFARMAKDLWVTGFNNTTCDCPAVIQMNRRYGVPLERFDRTFDVRELHLKLSGSKTRRGKLIEVAEIYGVKPKGNLHRAEADTVLTLETLNAIIGLYGLDSVCNLILPAPEGAVDKLTTQAVVRYVKSRKRVDVQELAKEFRQDHALVCFEVSKAIDERLVDADKFVDEAAQLWLQGALVELDLDVLSDGRLTVMHAALERDCPTPAFLNHVQLRIALLRAGMSWNSLKPA